MAKLVLTDVSVTLASTDISANVAAVTLTSSAAEVETTAFGQGAVTRTGGLKDNTVTLDIMNSFSDIEGLVYPLIGSTATIVIQPVSGAVGTASPSYTATVLITEWSPISGAVGELNTQSISWPVSGTITKTTS